MFAKFWYSCSCQIFAAAFIYPAQHHKRIVKLKHPAARFVHLSSDSVHSFFSHFFIPSADYILNGWYATRCQADPEKLSTLLHDIYIRLRGISILGGHVLWK